MAKPQRITVFQQKGSGETKIAGIRLFGGDQYTIETVDIDQPLPDIIDDASDYLPDHIDSDLVLDHLRHPDVSHDLWNLCERFNIPVIAKGKNISGRSVITPKTCCSLPREARLGRYGEQFGAPELKTEITDGIITGITIVRGAPCGATWEAAKSLIGKPVEGSDIQFGLKIQFYCSADPADWDVMYGKSPVHSGADMHKEALKKAIDSKLSKTVTTSF